jgi:cytoskeletal protein CcmA (bactofilin family)
LEASQIQVGSALVLTRGFHALGHVDLRKAKIDGDFTMSGILGTAEVGMDANLRADYLDVAGEVDMAAVWISGTLAFPGAKVRGRVRMRGVQVSGKNSGTGHSILADGLRADLGLAIDSAADPRITGRNNDKIRFAAAGSVSIKSASIGGQVAILHADIGAPNDPADASLAMENLRSRGDVRVQGCSLTSGIKLTGADVQGQIGVVACRLSNSSQSLGACSLDRAHATGMVAIRESLITGTISMIGANLDGSLFLQGTCVSTVEAWLPALAGVGLSVADKAVGTAARSGDSD